MSFKESPFDRFSHFDPESKLSEFRKNFFQNQNKMFSDSNRWPNGLDSRLSSMNSRDNRFGAKEEGIPIKVVHQTSDDRFNNESNDDKNHDSMSSFGSSQSQRSNDSSNSSGSVFNSSRSHDSSGGSGGETPRVYHIPITVEPREGSTSSGYTSEANVNSGQPLSRSSSHSSAHSNGSGSVRSQNRWSPPKTSSEPSNASNLKKETQIPIKVEVKHQNNQKSTPPPKESIPSPKSNGTPQTKPKPKSGPFVTRIPVVNPEFTPIPKKDSSPEPIASEMKELPKPDPLNRINEVLNDLKKYENEVKNFKGKANDKNYRFLDEMLTRFMIKLDTIETNGVEEVRKSRKAAILAVNQCIALLEQKVGKSVTPVNTTEQSAQSDEQPVEQSVEPMQTSTPEPTQQKVEENKAITESESQNIKTTEEMDTKTEDSTQETQNQNDSQNKGLDKNKTKESHRKETAV